MNFMVAFWVVIHKIFKWRPILLGCCDCDATYYLTKNIVVRNLKNTNGESEAVIACPNCGLEHLVLLVRLTPNTISVRYEIEEES